MSRLLPGLGAIHVLEFSWVLTLGDLGGAALPPPHHSVGLVPLPIPMPILFSPQSKCLA